MTSSINIDPSQLSDLELISLYHALDIDVRILEKQFRDLESFLLECFKEGKKRGLAMK